MSFEALEKACERWDRLVEEGDGAAAEAERMRERLVGRGIVAGGRPLCTVLRPHLITEDLLERQRRIASLIASAAGKVRDAVLADERLNRLHLGSLHDWVGDLIELEARPVGVGALVRLDASLARTRLHFIEINADMPQGIGHHDEILDAFMALDAYSRFASDTRIEPLRLEPPMRETLLSVWRDWGGEGTPSIGVLTRTDDAVRVSSLEIDVERYAQHGLEATICDPAELTYEGGRLRADNREIDLIHRVIGTGEVLADREAMAPLLDAVRDGAVCMVNPFLSELVGHKALFALMTDPEHDFGFDGPEREAIRDHVPWGRPVADGRTTDHDGNSVDLVEHLVADREHLVLKPSHDFGGHGVTLGWRTDEAGWRRAIEDALAADFIVQRRVPLHHREYPLMEPLGERRAYYEDTDPFLFAGAASGFLTRLSPGEITNVHAEGSVAPTFVIGVD
jgi:hypothetical protein